MHAHHADRQPPEFIPYRRMQKASPEAIWNRRGDLGERIAGSCEVFCETSSYGTRALVLYRQMMHGRKVLWCPALHPVALRIVVVIDACPIEPPNTSRRRQKRHTHAPRNSIPWDIALITSEILVKDDKMQLESTLETPENTEVRSILGHYEKTPAGARPKQKRQKWCPKLSFVGDR
jgi:hypothetical protein